MTGEQESRSRPAGKVDKQLEAALDTLTSRERRIIKLRFGLCGERVHTVEEIARMLKVSRKRVRQIEQRAIGKLRWPMNASMLEGFLKSFSSEKKEEGEQP